MYVDGWVQVSLLDSLLWDSLLPTPGAKTIKKNTNSTNLKLTMLSNTKLRHFWAQIVSWAPRHARKTFIVLAPGPVSTEKYGYCITSIVCWRVTIR